MNNRDLLTRLPNGSIRRAALWAGTLCLSWGVHAGVAQDVLRLADDVATHLNDTAYTHKPGAADPAGPDVQRMPNGRYSVHTDCSGWVTWLVQQKRPEALISLRNEMLRLGAKRKWPQAYVWQHLFTRLGGGRDLFWVGIADLRAAQPGDILSWCSDQYCDTRQEGGAHSDNTGHVAIVAAPPVVLDEARERALRESLESHDAELPPNTSSVYMVNVIDSSTTRHYDDQTRSKFVGTSGLGKGAIYIAVDENGKPLGVQFPGGVFRYEGAKAKDGERSVSFGIGRLLDPY
ncbi:hypothetical protein KSF73_03490 [Burkholderiaceae bacterium DAT-1]|nr:hypothetical protein [Burkholderiaceae bacterium DAT-1]